jgi:hypothetical protein
MNKDLNKLKNTLDTFIDEDKTKSKVCDDKEVCNIKSSDDLIERVNIEKKLVVEDGRELLKEETPITHGRTLLV